MKLEDLIDVNELPDLQESMDSRFTDLVWTRPSRLSFEATGKLKDETINLVIDLVTFTTSIRKYVLAQLAFERLVEGTARAGIIGLNKDTFPILGAMANAFRDKLKQLNAANHIDATFGLVISGEEDKIRLFKKLLTGGPIGLSMTTSLLIKSEHGTVVLASNEKLSEEEWGDLKNKLQEIGKTHE